MSRGWLTFWIVVIFLALLAMCSGCVSKSEAVTAMPTVTKIGDISLSGGFYRVQTTSETCIAIIYYRAPAISCNPR